MASQLESAPAAENEVSILARLLDNASGQLPREVATYILSIQLSDRDKARMHELAVRNQGDQLTPAEREEMHGFAKATSLLSLLKSRARRTLGTKLESPDIS